MVTVKALAVLSVVILAVTREVQKQPPEMFYKKRCSEKYHKIHRKAPVPESLFNKIAGLRTATALKKRL